MCVDGALKFRLGYPALAARPLELQDRGGREKRTDMGNRPENLAGNHQVSRLLGIQEHNLNLAFRVTMKCICQLRRRECSFFNLNLISSF